MKKVNILVLSILAIGLLGTGCKSTDTDTPVPTEPVATDVPEATKPESIENPGVTETPEVTETPDVTETPEVTEAPDVTETPDATEVPTEEGDGDMPTGKWFDKNGSTMLEFIGNKMYVTWWDGMDEPEVYDVKIENDGYDVIYIINADGNGRGFGIMSYLEICDDGSLRAYEEILDAEGHTYKFVPEDRIEEERAVKDFSKDVSKTIESKNIKSFSLCLSHYSPEKLYEGNYSWDIKKKEDGNYTYKFDGMGSSYVILKYECEVDSAYVKKLQDMIDEAGLAEHNGMFFSHDKNDIEYSLYVVYESGERMSLKVGSKALDMWPVDNELFMNYAMSVIPEDELER